LTDLGADPFQIQHYFLQLNSFNFRQIFFLNYCLEI